MRFCVVFVQCSGYLQTSWCGVVLHLLQAASGSVLVFKPLPSIKIWYVFGVLSKKEFSAGKGSDIIHSPFYSNPLERAFSCKIYFWVFVVNT
jgi:hypothetical protein